MHICRGPTPFGKDVDTLLSFTFQVTGRAFMPIESTEQYKKSKMAPVMETRGSKFCKFQEARLQEMADEVRGGGGLSEGGRKTHCSVFRMANGYSFRPADHSSTCISIHLYFPLPSRTGPRGRDPAHHLHPPAR